MSTTTLDTGKLRVLTPAQVHDFTTLGYTLLRDAFDPAQAAAARAILWQEMGLDPDEPSTWSREKIHLQTTHREPPFLACYSQRVRAAFDDLCGEGRWEHPGGLGWWPVTFPGFRSLPWSDAGGWHVDGQQFDHSLTSREQGLLAIFLLSDIGPGDGGTALAPRSHIRTAQVLQAAAPRALSPREMNQAVHHDLPWPEIVEANGRAGDLLLCHPFLSHSGSHNCGQRVRFMCNVCLPLKEDMQLHRPDADYSIVEQSIRSILQLD